MITRAKLVVDFSKKNKLLITVTLFFTVIGSMLSVLLPLSIGKFYELALNEKSLKGRLFDYLPFTIATNEQFFFFFAVLLILATVFVFAEKYSSGVIGEKFSRLIRELAFSTQLNQPVSVFESKPTGKYLLRYSGDLIFIQKFITVGIIGFVSDIIFLLLAIWALLILSTGLTAIVLLFLLIGFILIFLITGNLRKIISERRNTKSALLGFVSNRFLAFISIKSFNREKPETEQFKRRSKKVYEYGLKFFSRYSLVEALQPLFFYAAIGVVLYDVMMLREQKPYGIRKADVFAYILILLYMQKSFRRILKVNVIWRAGSVSYMKLLRVINRPMESQLDLQTEFDAKGKIVFEKVFFAYTENKMVLNNLSFTIQPNTVTLIDGKAGSGKTTLLKLLLDLYPNTTGKIFLDEIEYASVSPKSIRKNVTVVSNDIPLTGNTIFKAISYSRADEKRDKALASLEKLKFDSINNSSNILDFKLTDYGNNLSAGERKMLMFSRAFLTQKKILLLDEPFNGLDENNRAIIIERINNLRNRRTIIIATSDPLPVDLKPDQTISLSSNQ